MVYSERYSVFAKDRRDFFTTKLPTILTDARQTQDEKTSIFLELQKSGSKDHSYAFLALQKDAIETEFNNLLAALKKQGDDRKNFWLYCYYCSVMLQAYYEAYGYKDGAAKYAEQAEDLKYAYEHGRLPEKTAINEKKLQKKLVTDVSALAQTPRHTTKIKDWLGFTNIYRIHFTFCRIFIKQSLVFARQFEWLSKLQASMGRNVDDMIDVINMPAHVFNVLSVGLFGARLIINTGLILKHTFSPTEKEKDLNIRDRFIQELYKHHCTMLNDIAWASVNLVTNYAAIFRLSAPVASWLTAGFLVFDVALLMYRHYLAEHDYWLKKRQYEAELKIYGDAGDTQQKRMLKDQLAQLEIQWKTTSATLKFNIAAAALLMTGFTASLIFATPVAAVAFYFVCTIAVAMYLTADIYGKYKEKSLNLAQLRDDRYHLMQQESPSALELRKHDELIAGALLEVNTARNNFIIGMTKNMIMPLLIVATFAVCWQAALVLIVAYIGYECLKGYFKKDASKGVAALPPPQSPEAANDDSDDTDDEQRLLTVAHTGSRPG